MALYDRFTKAIDEFVDIKPLNFKTNPDVNYMLEHTADVCINDAKKKLKYLLENKLISGEDAKSFIQLNDSVGYPKRSLIFDDIVSSFGSLQYIYQSVLAINHFKTLSSSIDIVEIGGGYGGLALAMLFLAPKYGLTINSYTIVDLQSPLKLQKKYLENFNMSTNVNFSDAGGYGADIQKDNLFLLANYSFTEIESHHRSKYENILFPKLSHGFILWNQLKLYDFGFKYSVIPSLYDDPGNYIVTF